AGIAGALGTGLDLGVLVLLVGHHVSIPLATFIAALAGAVGNFALKKHVECCDDTVAHSALTTSARSRPPSPITVGQIARFHFVAVVAAVLLAAAMKIATPNAAVPVVAAQLRGAGVVFARL